MLAKQLYVHNKLGMGEFIVQHNPTLGVKYVSNFEVAFR